MRIKLPHSFTIIFSLIIIVAISTWFLPAGKFDTVYNEETNKNLVVAGTYHKVEPNPQGIQSILSSFANGLLSAADVVGYVLIVGGSYGIIMKTRALDAGFGAVIKKLGNKVTILIPILMFLFAIAGASTGFWEETLPFYLIVIPLIIAAGYDAMVGVAIVIIGAGTGVMASLVNPFAIGLASAIAEISIKEGFGLRLIFWLVSVSVSIIYVVLYARKVKKNPAKSIVAKQRQQHIEHFSNSKISSEEHELTFTGRRKIVVAAFCCITIFMIYAIIRLDWWFSEITMLFLGVAIFSSIIMGYSESEFWEYFIDGAKELLIAAIAIGLARGIVVVAQDGVIIDTILNASANALSGWSSSAFIILNEVVQIGIAFLVPSSSGHAALTIPIMAPLADLVGIPRVSVVMSMVFASGLVNMITPTAGVLMAGLSISKINYSDWVRFVLPLLAIQFVITLAFLIYSISAYN